MKSGYDDRRNPCGMEQQAAEGLEAERPALHAVVQGSGGGVADFFLAPVLGTEKGLHADHGGRVGLHAGVVPTGHLVDEEVVVAAA